MQRRGSVHLHRPARSSVWGPSPTLSNTLRRRHDGDSNSCLRGWETKPQQRSQTQKIKGSPCSSTCMSWWCLCGRKLEHKKKTPDTKVIIRIKATIILFRGHSGSPMSSFVCALNIMTKPSTDFHSGWQSRQSEPMGERKQCTCFN